MHGNSTSQKQHQELLLTNARLVTMIAGEQGYYVSPASDLYIKSGKLITSNNDVPHNIKTYDCNNKLVTPGFIDCHTHLVYAGNRANEFEMRLNGVPYSDIAKQGGGILSTVKATRNATQEELVEYALPRLDGLIRSE